MAALALMLCEAVENEDSKEVETLLKHGADPNLVLSNGIAATHLAAGKESECALRCLTLILQYGGDPNVRSIEELTPVHVAASWGCYKALVFLLRKGGDPSLQDQEGNTATDLALEEGNRRCVVALQEYTEREPESTGPEENHGYYKDDSSLPDDITQMSSISLLLESSYDNSPFSSTRLSPFAPPPKNVLARKGMDYAVMGSHMYLGSCGVTMSSERKEIHTLVAHDSDPNVCPKNAHNKSCNYKLDPSMVMSSKPILHASHSTENSNSKPDADVICVEIPYCKAELYTQSKTSIHGHICSLPVDYTEPLSHTDNSPCSLKSTEKGNLDILTDGIIPQAIKESMDGLDVTSPDHVYVFSRDSVAKDEDLEKTLAIQPLDENADLEEQNVSSSSKYNSCESDCYTSMAESPSRSEKQDENLEDETTINNKTNWSEIQLVKWANSQAQACRTTNVKVSLLENVKSPSKKMEAEVSAVDNRECSDISTEPLKECKEETSRQYIVGVRQTQSIGQEYNNSITETLGIVESSSLSPNELCDNGHGNDNQNLKDQLRKLLLATKACKQNISLCDKQYMGGNSRNVSALVSDTQDIVFVSSERKLAHKQDQMYNLHSKTTEPLTSLQSSPTYSSDTLNTQQIFVVPVERTDTPLNDELKNMMMSTKIVQSPSILDQMTSHSFVTPRTKSRLLSSNSRHNNTSLFDDTVDMPKRGRRIRSPDGAAHSPHQTNAVHSRKKLFPSDVATEQTQSSDSSLSWELSDKSNIMKAASNNSSTLTSELIQTHLNRFNEQDVNISNFLTDDLSSDMDRSKPTSRYHEIPDPVKSENTWLTEDGESSGDTIIGSNIALDKSLSKPLVNGSFLHSTCLENPPEKATDFTRIPRYSFSRLSCILRHPENDPCSSHILTVHDSCVQDVPLSPGGRPMNESHTEPMEYLYIDTDEGHTLIERHVPCRDSSSTDISESSDNTIIYDWRDYKSTSQKINKVPSSNRVAVELYRLSNDEIARRLRELGEKPGAITSQTRKTYISLLDKRIKESLNRGYSGSTGFNPELSLALRTFQIPECYTDEATLSQEFDQPDKTQKWREGVLKSSFNYLLLDPRVTRNLPSRSHTLSKNDCFRIFVNSVFYIGKGKRSRPYSHLYEALTHFKSSTKQPCSKVQHILDIWNSSLGAISLHCFQNTIPVEAYTREACMVDAIGLKMLTNQKKGVYYGQVKSWAPSRRRRLGVHMLHRAMQIFLAEGERQLRPPDISTGR
ncbi:ankyrin repeat and LEM domain-containing protein 1 [Bombina bombina]|uniref:ankyrin repeat and LEM domain-containing protein 1 n=1 Tax=Bombina bombina TaxID=8345 RepID=UPI00235A70DC|nr:ankyrin repeat and LEM domain-containing protein 1 [Bombina bombina]